MRKYDKYTFFWSGIFSQWDYSPFFLEGHDFSTCEQYMMYKKAILFNDAEIAIRILDEQDPRAQKKLGREVRNFNVDMWESVARDIVFRGNAAKFTQNNYQRDKLLETHGTLVVEASPYDKIWGIGLDEKNAIITPPENWPGRNWLGLAITEVRDTILGEILC